MAVDRDQAGVFVGGLAIAKVSAAVLLLPTTSASDTVSRRRRSRELAPS